MAEPERTCAVVLVVGDELLTGRTRDGNGAWLAERLTAQGLRVIGIQIVGDAAEAVADGVRAARARARVILVTGGLGPTDDDGTRAGLALAADAPLVESADALALVTRAQANRGFELDERRRREAHLPEGAAALPNPSGTAPGVAMTLGDTSLFAVPGVPRECRAMFEAEVAPRLEALSPLPGPCSYAFRVAGVREPDAADRVAALGIEESVAVAFYPHEGELEIRFTAPRAGAAEHAASRARAAFDRAAYDDVPIQVAVVRALGPLRADVTTAESLTGGLVARMLVEVGGASDVFRGGWVTYSDPWKRDALGVDPDLLAVEGAVSAPVAAAMAEGARVRAATGFAVATTGYAGPGDGRAPDGAVLPAGTFFVAVAGPAGRAVVERHHAPMDRITVQRRAAVAALDLLRRHLSELEDRRCRD